MLFLKSFLQRVKLAVLRHSFNGSNPVTVGLDGKDRTRLYRVAVEQKGASTAIGGVATDMRSR